MPSGADLGYGDVGNRLAALSQSLAVAGFFALELPDDFQHFGFQVTGGVPAARSVLVGLGGKPEGQGTRAPAAAQDVFDPMAFRGWKRLDRPTRWVYVYVGTPTAGATLHVVGSEGEPVPHPPTAQEIANAIAAGGVGTVSVNPVAVTWSAPAAVAMGAASASILAANAARKGFRIQNTGAVSVFIRKAAAAAVVASDIELLPDAVYEEGEGRTLYAGEVRGITAGAAGEVRVEEAT